MTKRYKIVFLGSGAFACPCLDRLVRTDADDVIAALCQPDKPCGRDRTTMPCAVKRHLTAQGVPILTPPDVNAPDSVQALKELAADLFVVVSYGQILKPAVISIPPLGCLNVHASLLPRLRGAAPITWAIARGDTTTGVTTMFINEQMDAGAMIESRSCRIFPEDTAESLHDRLAELGAELLIHTLELLRRGRAAPQPQDHAIATYAPKLKKSDGRMNWTMPAIELFNRVRAFHPWPGSHFEWPGASGKHVAVLQAAHEPSNQAQYAPGTIITLNSSGFSVQTGLGALRVLRVKPPGKSEMCAAAFARGRNIKPGDMLG